MTPVRFTKSIIFILLALVSWRCNDENNIDLESPAQTQDISSFTIDPSNCAPSTDPDLIIESALIEQNQLKLTIRYGGGCGTINNELLTCGYFLESNPVQLDIFLSHEDNDPCEALLKKEINFDLSPLIDLYENNYRERTGVIILRLNGFDRVLRFEF